MLTPDEVRELYGEIKLTFSYYHKYFFHYVYEDENVSIHGAFGGEAEEIYITHIDADDTVLVKDFEDELDSLQIEEQEKEVYYYYGR